MEGDVERREIMRARRLEKYVPRVAMPIKDLRNFSSYSIKNVINNYQVQLRGNVGKAGSKGELERVVEDGKNIFREKFGRGICLYEFEDRIVGKEEYEKAFEEDFREYEELVEKKELSEEEKAKAGRLSVSFEKIALHLRDENLKNRVFDIREEIGEERYKEIYSAAWR